MIRKEQRERQEHVANSQRTLLPTPRLFAMPVQSQPVEPLLVPSIRYLLEPGSAACRDLRLYEGDDIRNRDPNLPAIYEWAGKDPHPQRPQYIHEQGTRTWVITIDCSAEGKKRERELARTMKVPLGRSDFIRLEYGLKLRALSEIDG